ncbi:accessory regulator AgrB [Staphylococcus hyicus]|uniref:Accessory gene regulator protein B n=1 Tax=Staphylococcus hyicus TaxID=1284 RepID=A0A418JGA0_STAHY|nr:accessory gene regulator AgrB [Staphylococcus hyicus]MCQ9301636.1 accessory gene regulator AgrB [Staphylococcus hyicus]NJH80825.1 accessory regulator AgrB [Staphylococcus hyicus]RIO42864.1 accessory regulator AgrB [Staphylococcus hyicus]
MRIVDTAIDNLALKLQKRQNLDHIDYLKVRLGIQVFIINLFKGIVTYGLAILLNIFLYTLTVHLTYFILRRYSHGAHAKTSLLCHVQNIIFFIFLPWLIVKYDIPFWFMLFLSVLGWMIVFKYAPAATRKQPIKYERIKPKKIISLLVMSIYIVMILFVPHPYNLLIAFGAFLQSTTLLPIFFSKEE